MKALITTLLTTYLLLASNHALALKKGENFNYAYCDLDDEFLADPDRVMGDLIMMARNDSSSNCSREIIVEQDDPWLGQFPAKAAKQLKMFGEGIYREHKILKKEKGPHVDGYETLIYTVELNYIYAELESGIVPICERSIVPIRLIKTPWGWYPKTRYGFGSSMNGHARRYESIQPRGQETIKKYKIEMARMHKASALHCPRLTSTETKEK